MSELSIILSYAVFASCVLYFGVRCYLALKPGKNSGAIDDRYEAAFDVGRWILLAVVVASVVLLMLEVLIAELQSKL